jgi:hypothetical protein
MADDYKYDEEPELIGPLILDDLLDFEQKQKLLKMFI